MDNIQLESAWDITLGSYDVIVAVIDDAIDINHPDLSGNMMPGYDFVDRDNDPSPGQCLDPLTQTETLEQHGTQVAGVIGAVENNKLGIVGVSPRVKIMPLRIGCHYPRQLEVEAVQYAIDKGADIINASYGGPSTLVDNRAVLELLKTAGKNVLFITSAGNQQTNNDDVPMYPGNLGLPNVLTVAASGENNQLTEWAQYGAASVDLSAPGVGLLTTMAINDGYGQVSGSSFSTAVVSGVAALVKARDSNDQLSAADLKAVLQASVSPMVSQIPLSKTAGLINARAALDLWDSPRPIMSITQVTYEDRGAVFENAQLDENKFGVILVELENLWSAVLTGSVTVSVDSAFIQLPTTFFNLSAQLAGERKVLSIPVQTSRLSGHERIRFVLDIRLTSAGTAASYTRYFELQAGVLVNNTAISALIQKNDQDDYHYYHFNIPPDKERVAITLEHAALDSRSLGLLADFDQRPKIHFAAFNGAPYWYSATFRSDNQTAFERLGFRIPAINASTLNIMVFNQPASNPTTPFDYRKPYELTGCFYSETDGNVPPKVDAGRDKRVSSAETVTLSGSVSDSDGQITRAYWRSNSKISFSIVSDYEIKFEAPDSGVHRFSLVAIDDGCKQTVDSVTVTVEALNGTEPDGLILNPRTLNVDENSRIDVRVSGFFEAKEVTDLKMVFAPEGVTFSNGQLLWKDTSPVGTYPIKFSTRVEGELLFGTITVNIRERSVGNGGGCVAVKNAPFDPLFFIYLLLSSFFIHNKMQLRRKNGG